MRKFSTRSLFGLALFLAGHPLSAPAARAAPTPFREVLGLFGVTYAGEDDFVVEESHPRGDWRKTARPGYWTVIAASGRRKMRLEAARNIGRRSALEKMDDRFASVEGLFKGYAFYPGMITQQFEVPPELGPEILSPGPRGYKTYVLYSTAQMTYGVGDPGLAVHRGALTYRYCPETKTLVEVELFFPAEDFNKEGLLKELESFYCR